MIFSIRAADAADISSIQTLARAVWPVAYRAILSDAQLEYMLDMFYSAASLARQMEEGHTFFLAADEVYKPIGFSSYSVKQDSTAHLHKLYVLPETQGSGVGRELLFHAETMAQSADGATKMQLNVNRHNRAKDFYERQGYRILLEEDIDIGQDYFMNDFRMEKTLHPKSVAV